MTGYKASEVAEVLGLSVRQVRSYARSQIVTPGRGPRNEYRFSFHDIVVLRAASDLLKARVHPRKVRGALGRLRAQLPRGRSLAELRITTDGGRIVVRDRDTAWEPESEQVVLGFAVADLASRAAPFARRVVREGADAEELDADGWYNLAHDLEAVSGADAKEAYLQAVALDGGHMEAHLNLGRLLHEEGDLAAAERQYRLAIEMGEAAGASGAGAPSPAGTSDGGAARPTLATAWFNLGVALEDRGRPDEALDAYERAVALDAELAPAHYNVSRLLEARGDPAAALRHLSEYRRLRGSAAGSRSEGTD